MTPPKPGLRLFDFTMIVVSLVIGMGIFRTPVNVARDAPSAGVFFAVWVAGGVVALCGALTYAEIGSRLPVTGGYYKVFSYAYHPSVAFAINCVILVSNAASLAGVALIGGEYISAVVGPVIGGPLAASKALQMAIAVGAIALFYGINLLGLKLSARTQSALMIIKITLILLLILPLFLTKEASPAVLATAQSVTLSPTMNQYLLAFGSGLVAVSFTYGGYQQTINFGAEVRQPARNLPRGIFLGIALIITLYLAINWAYVHVIGFDNLKAMGHQEQSPNIAALMAARVFGPQAERVLSVFLFLGVLGYVNALLLSNPRVMYAMSEDGILPPAFRRRHPRTGVLVVSLTIFAVLCMLIVGWAQKFETVLGFSIFLDCFGMILSAGSIFLLRRRTRHLDETGIFKMKAYPLQPVLFIFAYLFVAISLLKQQTELCLIGIGVMSLFIGLYFLVFGKAKTSMDV
ncbi:APC family permease [Flaviaesturariibacter aridisoli]|uniref:APC family permease n=1 Tax=Flaviaesturariibacter aridisoli TaxID=2545761 RepID=A0A4R4E615_9BACT|nr:APC family permease [Flaviaesturariibacter aridisoli]TCZ73481.1 APC family permease [Flaviaesturariibacter aridisoli]